MVLRQKVPTHCSTFGKISDYLLMKILSTKQKYAKFFQNPENKMSLVKTLLNVWKKKKATVFKEKKLMQHLIIKVSMYLRTMVQFKRTSYVTYV